jgi:hypothetical protein
MAPSKSNPKKALAVADWNAFLQEPDPESLTPTTRPRPGEKW